MVREAYYIQNARQKRTTANEIANTHTKTDGEGHPLREGACQNFFLTVTLLEAHVLPYDTRQARSASSKRSYIRTPPPP